MIPRPQKSARGFGLNSHDLVRIHDRHPVRVIGQGDHDPLDDESARGGAGEGTDQVRQLVPGQPLLTEGGVGLGFKGRVRPGGGVVI